MTRSPDSATQGAAPRGRSSWSGLLRLSLVTVPVKAYPAVSTSDTISLNQLHAGCGQRIRYEKRCPVHGPVDATSIARGYQYAPDQYVIVESEELERIRPPKEQALTLEQFVDSGQVDPARFAGRTLHLMPHGLAAHRPYRVLQQAMQQRGRWALGRVAMSGHRYAVVVCPAAGLLSMLVLHDPTQVRSAAAWQSQLREESASEQELQLAATLIDAASGPVDWSTYRDDTAQQLERLVEAKVAGRPLPTPEAEPVQVLELLEALKQSVAAAEDNASPATNGKTARRAAATRRRSA